MLAPYYLSEQLRDEAYSVAREALSFSFAGSAAEKARLHVLAMKMVIVAERVEEREALRCGAQQRPSRLRCVLRQMRRRWAGARS